MKNKRTSYQSQIMRRFMSEEEMESFISKYKANRNSSGGHAKEMTFSQQEIDIFYQFIRGIVTIDQVAGYMKRTKASAHHRIKTISMYEMKKLSQ